MSFNPMDEPDYVLFGTELAMPDKSARKLMPYLMGRKTPPKWLIAEISASNEERDSAMLSMDKQRIIAYARNQDVDMNNLPRTDEHFWAAVHICISGVESLPMDVRQASKRWLNEHGMPVFDDGMVQV